MPITTVATNDVLTASYFNSNIRDQVVSTTTSGARPAGTEGQFIYETDTNRLYVYTGAAWEMVYQQGAWTAYTPQVDQGATTNIAKTTTYAKYAQFGKTVHCRVNLSLTAAGTANAAVVVSLPVTASNAPGNDIIGSGLVRDASAGSPNCPANMLLATTTSVYFLDNTQATNVVLGQTGSLFAAALASTDNLSFAVTYEAA